MIKRVYAANDLGNTIDVRLECFEDTVLATIKKEEVDAAGYIDIYADLFVAEVGEDGYFMTPNYNRQGYLTYFKPREDTCLVENTTVIPIYGVKKKNIAALAMPDGMMYEMYVTITVKDGKYYLGQRVMLNGRAPYEDITVRYKIFDSDIDYCDMAVYYRNRIIESGRAVPIEEKIKTRPLLAYAVEAPEIRVRMGWKPVPSPVEHQTLDNEPPMHVACTFDRVKDLIDSLKKKGVDKAEICLVGWNKSGHDGRWPDMFPVEEKLGGEKALRDLIQYGQQNGYQITCHTNSTDSYTISPYHPECVAMNYKGENTKGGIWGAGRAYIVCPTRAREIAHELLPAVEELGFKGLHYIDVISVTNPPECHDPRHPCNRRLAVQEYQDIMKLCQRLFGGFSSEGAYDFAVENLDYGFYVDQGNVPSPTAPVDVHIPIHQLIFHGIVLTNPSTKTVNVPIRDTDSQLYFEECGGRLTFYIYQKFITPVGSFSNWLGNEDLTIDDEKQLDQVTDIIAKSYDHYKEVSRLQSVFMDRYDIIEEGVKLVTYHDGTRLVSNHNDRDITFEGHSVAARSYKYI